MSEIIIVSVIFLGKVNQHEQTGCSVCETEIDCIDSYDTVQCDCGWHKQKRHLDQYKVEINIRSKTCARDSCVFPNKEVGTISLHDNCYWKA